MYFFRSMFAVFSLCCVFIAFSDHANCWTLDESNKNVDTVFDDIEKLRQVKKADLHSFSVNNSCIVNWVYPYYVKMMLNENKTFFCETNITSKNYSIAWYKNRVITSFYSFESGQESFYNRKDTSKKSLSLKIEDSETFDSALYSCVVDDYENKVSDYRRINVTVYGPPSPVDPDPVSNYFVLNNGEKSFIYSSSGKKAGLQEEQRVLFDCKATDSAHRVHYFWYKIVNMTDSLNEKQQSFFNEKIENEDMLNYYSNIYNDITGDKSELTGQNDAVLQMTKENVTNSIVGVYMCLAVAESGQFQRFFSIRNVEPPEGLNLNYMTFGEDDSVSLTIEPILQDFFYRKPKKIAYNCTHNHTDKTTEVEKEFDYSQNTFVIKNGRELQTQDEKSQAKNYSSDPYFTCSFVVYYEMGASKTKTYEIPTNNVVNKLSNNAFKNIKEQTKLKDGLIHPYSVTHDSFTYKLNKTTLNKVEKIIKSCEYNLSAGMDIYTYRFTSNTEESSKITVKLKNSKISPAFMAKTSLNHSQIDRKINKEFHYFGLNENSGYFTRSLMNVSCGNEHHIYFSNPLFFFTKKLKKQPSNNHIRPILTGVHNITHSSFTFSWKMSAAAHTNFKATGLYNYVIELCQASGSFKCFNATFPVLTVDRSGAVQTRVVNSIKEDCIYTIKFYELSPTTKSFVPAEGTLLVKTLPAVPEKAKIGSITANLGFEKAFFFGSNMFHTFEISWDGFFDRNNKSAGTALLFKYGDKDRTIIKHKVVNGFHYPLLLPSDTRQVTVMLHHYNRHGKGQEIGKKIILKKRVKKPKKQKGSIIPLKQTDFEVVDIDQDIYEDYKRRWNTIGDKILLSIVLIAIFIVLAVFILLFIRFYFYRRSMFKRVKEAYFYMVDGGDNFYGHPDMDNDKAQLLPELRHIEKEKDNNDNLVNMNDFQTIKSSTFTLSELNNKLTMFNNKKSAITFQHEYFGLIDASYYNHKNEMDDFLDFTEGDSTLLFNKSVTTDDTLLMCERNFNMVKNTLKLSDFMLDDMLAKSCNMPYSTSAVRISSGVNIANRDTFINKNLPCLNETLTVFTSRIILRHECAEFYETVYRLEPSVIVMLSSTLSTSNSLTRYRYWPTTTRQIFGKYDVRMEKFEATGPLEVRDCVTMPHNFCVDSSVLTLSSEDDNNDPNQYNNISPKTPKKAKNVQFKHLFYSNWETDSTPICLNGLVNMVMIILDEMEKNPNRPIIIHCNDGFGKSGTVLSLVILFKMIIVQLREKIMLANEKKSLNIVCNVVYTMSRLRYLTGHNYVNHTNYYSTLYYALYEKFFFVDYEITCYEMLEKASRIEYFYAKQHLMLKNTKKMASLSKNKKLILNDKLNAPYDDNMALLTVQFNKEGRLTDTNIEEMKFVNASYIQCCMKNRAFIAAASPENNNMLEAFWEMVCHNDVGLIFDMTVLKEYSKDHFLFYPLTENSKSLKFKNFKISYGDEYDSHSGDSKVKQKSQNRKNNETLITSLYGTIRVRAYTVKYGGVYKKSKKVEIATLVQNNDVNCFDHLLCKASQYLLNHPCYKDQEGNYPNEPIAVVSPKGSNMGGVLLASAICIECVKTCKFLNVPLMVRNMFRQRDNIIKDENDFVRIYNVMKCYYQSEECSIESLLYKIDAMRSAKISEVVIDERGSPSSNFPDDINFG